MSVRNLATRVAALMRSERSLSLMLQSGNNLATVSKPAGVCRPPFVMPSSG